MLAPLWFSDSPTGGVYDTTSGAKNYNFKHEREPRHEEDQHLYEIYNVSQITYSHSLLALISSSCNFSISGNCKKAKGSNQAFIFQKKLIRNLYYSFYNSWRKAANFLTNIASIYSVTAFCKLTTRYCVSSKRPNKSWTCRWRRTYLTFQIYLVSRFFKSLKIFFNGRHIHKHAALRAIFALLWNRAATMFNSRVVNEPT